jgi:hypothetical protein
MGGVDVLARGLESSFAAILVLLSVSALAFQSAIESPSHRQGSRVRAPGQRGQLSESELPLFIGVDEFAFDQAIAAYECLIDATHAGTRL